MDLSFVFAFFASKKVTLLTAFVCWEPGSLLSLWKSAALSGAKLSVWTDFHRLPDLPAYDVHRQGILLDYNCPEAQLVLGKASITRALNLRYTWLLLHNSSFQPALIEELIGSALILPDADLTWATSDALVDLYRVKEGEPLLISKLGVDPGVTREQLEKYWAGVTTTVARRKNLKNVFLKSDVIVSQPQYFKGWNDLTNRQIDTFPKVTFPIMMLAAEDLNYRYNMRQVDLYGEEHNGSFTGLAGRLQRHEAELGVASMFLRADRWRVLHYCAETVELRGAFMFRQPTQASVSNVFVLPFSRGVWLACAGVLAAAAVLMAVLARRFRRDDVTLAQLSPAELFTFAIGVMCQQGFYITPQLASIRLIMFSVLTLALFTFTAYSAKVVVILQAPSDAIQTISDLSHSSMACGVQETTYKKVYFAESKDPATQRLYRKKLLPLGDAAYMSVVDGIAKMRTGRFAFQVEESSGYDIISQTFTEREKCGLQQIQAFKLPMVAVPIRKHSGYRDLLAARLRWQREVGLMDRFRRIWMARKQRCDASGGGFDSVGLLDVLPCVQILCLGTVLASLLLIVELITHKVKQRNINTQKKKRNWTEDFKF